MERWQQSGWPEKMAVRLDFSNMMSDSIGNNRGITREEIDKIALAAAAVARSLRLKRDSGEWGFFQLPYDTAAADAIARMAGRLRGKFTDFVVLGIGGSALGGSALFQALCSPFHNLLSEPERNGLPRVFFADNIDPVTFGALLDIIDPEKTLFNVVTKSGSTAETISQFLIVRDMLRKRIGRQAEREHFVITTGQNNELRELAEKEGFTLLAVPENVGGRFSVLSPVGLFPAAMFGVDIAELLAGARFMEERCRADELWKNPAYLGGTLHYIGDAVKKLHISVLMPYSDALYRLAFWFRQLWAESLGKAINLSGETVNNGQTPVAALGATDQHSQLQLYLEGPLDKMITFLTVGTFSGDVSIPRQTGQPEEFSYLGGHTLGELMNIEARATKLALTKAGRSNMSLILPEINPFTVGQLLYLLQLQTAFTGGLYGIDPMNQPAVEAGKQYAYGMLGRKSFEAKAAEAGDHQEQNGRYIV